MEDKTLQLTEAQFNELGTKMAEHAERSANVEKTLEELKSGYSTIQDIEVEAKRSAKDIAALKTHLMSKHGPSGAADWLVEMAKFVSGVWHEANVMTGKSRGCPDGLALSNGVKVGDLFAEYKVGEQDGQKAAADFTTGTASAPYAGYLLPEILRPGIIELKDIYGNIYPKVTKFTVPAGVNVHMPADAANPAATWRDAGQVTDIGEEATPMTFGRRTINTEVAGAWIQIANELLSNPAVNFGAVATSRMLRAIMRLVETSMLVGDSGTTGPSDGILNTTNVWDQGTIATASFANIVTFLKACLADDVSSFDPTSMSLVMHPRDILALASEAVGASELTGMLTWGDPRSGAPGTLLGYEVLAHPAQKVSTTYYATLTDLSDIMLGEDPTFTVDINPFLESAFKENSSWLRVFSHYDWAVGQPTQHHFTVVTA